MTETPRCGWRATSRSNRHRAATPPSPRLRAVKLDAEAIWKAYRARWEKAGYGADEVLSPP